MKKDTVEKGVYITKKKDGSLNYRASFTYHNKHISLGSFKSAESASDAYKQALFIMHSDIEIHDFKSKFTHLPFEKWVILINLRDNQIYFSTPIYVHSKYFSYYLDAHTELKFSIDDLFYYSSHKIMRRGGHLFVADYGSQVTILERYGIKPYGIAGKDYILRNNDPFDFRYENIEVHNSYHGVSYLTHYGKPLYQARIHLHGNFVIGYFKDADTAAIAYNKAIDVVKANGIKKNFKQNYTESISPSMYADIYSSITIPEKICSYRAE